MKLTPYWLDTAPTFTGAEAGTLSGRVDVAIVGGGFTGLSSALAFAKRGLSVVVLEAGQIAGQASGRNGGQCNTGVAQDFASLAEKCGMPQAKAYYCAYADAVETVQSIVRDERIDCDLRQSGKLKLAAKPHHFDALKRTYEAIVRNVDQDVALLDAQAVQDEIASDGFYGGLVQRQGVQMHMGKFGVGLAEAVTRHGGRIFEQTPVTGLKRLSGYSHEVSTPRGVVRADRVLLATGTSQIGPLQWFQRRIAPVGSFIVVTEPLGQERLSALLPGGRSYVTTRHIGNYFRPTADGRLLFGGRARFAMSNPRSDVKSGTILRAGMLAYFPQLADVQLAYCWGGLVDMTADRLPHAGETEGLFYSMGYSGHGVQMSVHMGQCMADVVMGDGLKNPWRDRPWAAIPGHFGRAWFLPLVGLYYRYQDAVS
jgi:glycine/D-amino acid oxidase-like deaminating enzyme